MINLVPFHDFVLVERKDLVPAGKSLIIVPDAAKEKPQYGHVLAVGPGRTTEDGKLIPCCVRGGDDILFAKYAGVEVELNGMKIIVMKESEILGRVTIETEKE